MSREFARARSKKDLAPCIRHVIAAARSRLAGSYRPDDAAALQELARLAAVSVPSHGVLAPVDGALIAAIETIAERRLGQHRATRRFRRALRHIKTFGLRDAIDVAHGDVLRRTAAAYYYAGLASGITWVETRRGHW